jgi:hypothetical protein
MGIIGRMQGDRKARKPSAKIRPKSDREISGAAAWSIT